MLIRLLMVLLIPFLLIANQSNAEIKAAVMQNPALLNTPQAQEAMKKAGVTPAQVEQKLNGTQQNTASSSNAIPTAVQAQNSIDTNTTTNSVDQNSSDNNKTKSTSVITNPFKYSENISYEQNKLTPQKTVLSRYSLKFFTNKNSVDSTSLPTPNNYVIATGDQMSVQVYGDQDQTYTLDVTNEGNVNVPMVGPVKVAGMTYEGAKERLKGVMKSHYSFSDFAVRMTKYSTIQATLVGDVKNPGLYNLSSFATVKDLLLEAKGVSETGSVRNVIIKRNGHEIANVDFYDLFFNGNSLSKMILKQGDVIVVKKAAKLVSVDGYVNNTAIFELKEGETLEKLIYYAGGMKPDASKTNIKVTRFINNVAFDTIKVDYKDAKNFKMRDGDKVYIYPLSFNTDQSINVYGNVIRPGSYNIHTKENLTTFLRDMTSEGMKSFFLPDTDLSYGVIKRYSDALKYETISFNIKNVLDANQTIVLKPQDQIFIFNKNDIFANSYVTTKGENLQNQGKLQYYKGMTIRDAINASKILNLIDDKVKLTTYSGLDHMPSTSFYSLNSQGDTVLHPLDEIEVSDYYTTHKMDPINIKGEVIYPTSTFYEKGMTLKKLIDMAGGFTQKAYTRSVEIVRYFIDDEQNRQRSILKIDLQKKNINEIELMPYDEVTIFSIPKWSERKVVTLNGQVKFPGTYVIDSGERLASVIERAGGFSENAFIKGAVFTRESIRKNQVEQYNASLSKIKKELAIFNAMPANAKNLGSTTGAAALDGVITDAQKYMPIGRVSLKLDENLSAFKKSPYNIVLENNDSITIPQDMDTVTVFGEVYNPSSFIFDSKNSVDDYIKFASGLSTGADKGKIYIIHADGSSEPINNGWFHTSVKVAKGDTIVVPLYIQEYSNLDVWTSISGIFSNFAVTAASLKAIGAFQ